MPRAATSVATSTGSAAVTEGAEDAVARALVEPAVQGGREDALLAQLEGDAVGAELGADEDHGAAVAVGDLGGDGLLVHRVDEQHVVLHRGDRGLGVVGRVRHRVGEVALDQLVDALVEGGREQQPLAARRHLVEDRGDLGHEAHVGHVVGLVEDGDLDVARSTAPRSMRSLSRPGVAMSRSTPRFRALICGRVGQATGDELVAQAEDVHEGLERVGDLHGQLAGRHQDEGARAARRRLARRRRGGPASAGRRPASCRSRSGRGRGRPAGEGVGDGRGLDRERRR